MDIAQLVENRIKEIFEMKNQLPVGSEIPPEIGQITEAPQSYHDDLKNLAQILFDRAEGNQAAQDEIKDIIARLDDVFMPLACLGQVGEKYNLLTESEASIDAFQFNDATSKRQEKELKERVSEEDFHSYLRMKLQDPESADSIKWIVNLWTNTNATMKEDLLSLMTQDELSELQQTKEQE